MPGQELARILSCHQADHLVLITTMRQLLGFVQHAPEWRLAFDFVIDGAAPKQSKSRHQPNYLHQTGVYFTRSGAKSAFDRRRRQRSDTFESNGYWPTIMHAPRDRMGEHGHAKNVQAITDILGSFAVSSVLDPFAGTGSTAMAAFELEISAALIEKDPAKFEAMQRSLRFFGSAYGNLEVIR